MVINSTVSYTSVKRKGETLICHNNNNCLVLYLEEALHPNVTKKLHGSVGKTISLKNNSPMEAFSI